MMFGATPQISRVAMSPLHRAHPAREQVADRGERGEGLRGLEDVDSAQHDPEAQR
jgi:hypothetical protein